MDRIHTTYRMTFMSLFTSLVLSCWFMLFWHILISPYFSCYFPHVQQIEYSTDPGLFYLAVSTFYIFSWSIEIAQVSKGQLWIISHTYFVKTRHRPCSFIAVYICFILIVPRGLILKSIYINNIYGHRLKKTRHLCHI